MKKRRRLDQYFTPSWATKVLLAHYPHVAGNILECCSGEGHIAKELEGRGWVVTNDIDPALPSHLHHDATDPYTWPLFAVAINDPLDPNFDWVISNPPFNVCQPIVEGACGAARKGVAMLLRLSYLEPCENRANFLSCSPPTHCIVLPRISFTGDGKTDNVTCAWFVWEKGVSHQRLTIVGKEEAKSY